MMIATAALALMPTAGGAQAGATQPGASQPGGPPPTGGTISIAASTADGNDDPALPIFVDAVERELTARGFTMFDDAGHAAAGIELVLSHGEVGTGLGRVPGQRSVSPFGTGVSVPLSTGASDLVSLRRTQVELRIHRRGETAIVWHAAAVTVRNSGARNGSDAAVAADLSRALLAAYPAIPRDVIGIP